VTEDKLDPNVLDLSSEDIANTPNGTEANVPPAIFKRIVSRSRTSRRSTVIPSIYTIVTDFAHDFQVGDTVIVSGIDSPYNGVQTVDEIVDPFTFTYLRDWENDDSQGAGSTVVTIINKECTSSTATISFSGSFFYPFAVGDVIEVDGLGAPFDGVFKITSTPSATSATYDFATSQTPVASTPTSGGAYPTVIKYVVVGSTWKDSTNDNLYQWDGTKWVLINAGVPEGVVVDDGIAPQAPTDLTGTTTAYFDGNLPRARVALTWTAPTLNADTTPLTDLEGYEIFKRYDPLAEWEIQGTSTGPSFTVLNLLQNTLTYFMVRAKDITGNRSADSSTFSITTAVSSVAVVRTSTPVATTRLGTITIQWDGLDFVGGTLDTLPEFSHVEVHQSTTNNFTPSSSTLVDRLTARGLYVAASLVYGTPYYFKLVSVDTAGNKTTASAQATATTARLVDTDLIANTLSTWPFAGNVVAAGSLADGSVNASTLLGPNVVVQSAIAANAIGVNQLAAGSVIAGKIGANAVTANTVAANAITAGKIDTNAVTADTIQAGAITGDKIEANAINGKIITGATVRTSASFPRVEMNTSGLFVYNAGAGAVVSLNSNGTASFAGTLTGSSGTFGGITLDSSGITANTTGTINFNAGSGTAGYLKLTSALGSGTLELASPSSGGSAYLRLWGLSSSPSIDLTSTGGGTIFITAGSNLYLRATGSIFVDQGDGIDSTRSLTVRGQSTTLGHIYLPNPNIGTGGGIARINLSTSPSGRLISESGSSQRYKNSIVDVGEIENLDPKNLLNIPVRAFKFNSNYISEEDERYDQFVPGFIAEEVEELYPVAVDHSQEGPERWNPSFIIPGMLSLIQDLSKEVQNLKSRLDQIENSN